MSKKRKYLSVIILLILLMGIIIIWAFINKDNHDFQSEFLSNPYIKTECIRLGIKPRVYISIIYGELKNNFNEWDRFDNFRAKIGMDPSVGFAQIKISTAEWIEDKYSGNKFIYKSNTHDELVHKLINDSTNTLYSVFYIKLIMDKLIFKFKREPTIKLLASYYGSGIDYYREDNIDILYYNQIGITAQEFYDSDKLLDYFPK